MAPRVERRLAAILAADVVGYSRLMEADEAGTHARLKALRKELIEPRISDHAGRIAKLTGDGALVEFPSVVEAVLAAADIQRAVTEQQAGVPDAERIAFRIGINLGDVIFDEEDIYGDGVNVAARLEALAEPGGICVARTVYNHVRKKLDLGFEPGGAHRVKNIAEPVEVYRVRWDGQTVGAAQSCSKPSPRWAWPTAAAAAAALILAGGATWWSWTGLAEKPTAPLKDAVEAKPTLPLPGKPSIAVLPLDNLSAEERYARLANGLTEDIITDLSRFRDLFVIARNSSFVYKDKPTDVRQIGRELGVQYVLEGSLQAEDGRVRITAQLIEATTGNHIWSERYDRPLDDIFAIQNEVTQTVAASIGGFGGAVARSGQEAARRKPPHSLQAYDYYMLAAEHRQRITEEDNEQARQLSQEAIKIDPSFARAYISLAQTYIDEIDLVWTKSRQRSMDNWLRAIQKAISLDPSDSEAHLLLGVYYSYENEFDRSLAQLEEAVELNPNNADMLAKAGGNLLPFFGRRRKALTWLSGRCG